MVPELIALDMPGGQLFVDQLRRAWDQGNAVLPVDSRLPDAAKADLMATMGASAVVDARGERQALGGGRPTEVGDALVIATSGSTGAAKGVVHTHGSIEASATITSNRLQVTGDDHWLACLPVSHIGGLSVVTRAIHKQMKLTVHPRFDAGAAMASGANLISLVPTALQRIDASKFKTILLGGAAAPLNRPDNTIMTYGSTETGSGIVYEDKALDGVELMIDADGQLLVKSPTLLRCYRDGTDPRDSNGWYPTGDAASFDANAVLVVHGRMAELINTGGEKVWPTVVETVIKTHPAVAEALVFGQPDEEWGERVVVCIEVAPLAAPPSLEAVRAQVRETLPAYAAPKELRIVKHLARTPNGKVDRSESARI